MLFSILKKISFIKGKGSYLYTSKGTRYLDFVQGIAVNSLGHAHPKLVSTINKQSKKQNISNNYQSRESYGILRQILRLWKVIFKQP